MSTNIYRNADVAREAGKSYSDLSEFEQHMCVITRRIEQDAEETAEVTAKIVANGPDAWNLSTLAEIAARRDILNYIAMGFDSMVEKDSDPEKIEAAIVKALQDRVLRAYKQNSTGAIHNEVAAQAHFYEIQVYSYFTGAAFASI